ncbi:hypothetical protein BKA59DRAFT_368977, partial [Fusarium tricinctum]
AVLVHASRAAARHEVRKQELMETQREDDIQRGIEMQRREEEEELQTQRAVDEAMKKAALETQAAQQRVPTVSPLPQYRETYPSVQVQTQDMGLYGSVQN